MSPKLPFPVQNLDSHPIHGYWPTGVHPRIGVSIGSDVFPGLINVIKQIDREIDRDLRHNWIRSAFHATKTLAGRRRTRILLCQGSHFLKRGVLTCTQQQSVTPLIYRTESKVENSRNEISEWKIAAARLSMWKQLWGKKDERIIPGSSKRLIVLCVQIWKYYIHKHTHTP